MNDSVVTEEREERQPEDNVHAKELNKDASNMSNSKVQYLRTTLGGSKAETTEITTLKEKEKNVKEWKYPTYGCQQRRGREVVLNMQNALSHSKSKWHRKTTVKQNFQRNTSVTSR